MAVAANLASVVAALHARDDHVVDLKPANVHVYRGSGRVAMLDCDGFSVAGPDGARFPAHQYTDGYIAPEALRAQAKPEALGEPQDLFALAVVAFRLLNRGLHPFQGVPQPGAAVPTTDGERVAAGLYPYGSGAGRLAPPPASLYGALDRATRRLFDRAFDGAEGAGRRRPSGPATCGCCSRAGSGPASATPTTPATADARAGCARRTRRGPLAAWAGFLPVTPPRPPPRSSTSSYRPPGRDPLPRPPPPTAVRGQTSVVGVGLALSLFAGVLVGLFVWLVAGVDGGLYSDFDYYPDPDAILYGIENQDLGLLQDRLGRGVDLDYGLLQGSPQRERASPYGPLDNAVGYPHLWRPREQALDDLVPEYDPYLYTSEPYLYAAAQWSRPTAAQILIDAGVPVDGHDFQHGRTALMVAAASAGTPVALRRVGPDAVVRAGQDLARWARSWVDAPARDRGEVPDALYEVLRAAADLAPLVPPTPYGSPGGRERLDPIDSRRTATLRMIHAAAVVDLLLQAGADVEAEDGRGRRALAYAAASGNAETVRQLLAAGADPNAADLAGVTALMVTADQAADPRSDAVAAAVVAELLAYGADPGQQDAGGRAASDYVGEREATRFVKTTMLGLDEDTTGDVETLDRSLSLALLRVEAGAVRRAKGAESSGEGRAAGHLLQDLEAVAVPPGPPADLGDGGTRFVGRGPVTASGYTRAIPRDTTVAASCPGVAPSDVASGVLYVTVAVDREASFSANMPERFFEGRPFVLYAAEWGVTSAHGPIPRGYLSRRQQVGYDRQSCLRIVRSALSGGGDPVYDLTGEAERWPLAAVRVEILDSPADP